MNINNNDPWYRREALYQIYPLSFSDSNGDGFGDLRGIIERLDYLNDNSPASLGIGAIWLSPIFTSPMADWGYDVENYCDIDPLFGTLSDFDELLAQAHSRGIKVLLDYVLNHTSSLHPWFVDSRTSRQSEKRDWYIWADSKVPGTPPNNWLSKFGGSAWKFDEATGQYYMHTFLSEQPDLNWHNPHVRSAMLEVLRFWHKRGVDGFRADAVMSLVKDPLLRDNPPNPAYVEGSSDPADKLLPTYSAMENGVGEILGAVCSVISESSDTFLLSETYLNIPGLQHMYDACREHPVHAPFNFNLMTLSWSARAFQEFIDEYETMLGPEDWPNYVLGNHDGSRLATRLGLKKARLMAFLQMTLRGLPVIYNGDELGLSDGVIESHQRRDPASVVADKKVLPRDVARTPFPWNQDTNAGFTTGEPWLPLSPDWKEHNVSSELVDPGSMHEMYRHLLHLRRTLTALTEGSYRSLETDNAEVFAYVREDTYTRCYVITNFSSAAQSVSLKSVGNWIAGTHLVHGDGLKHESQSMELEPYEGRIYEIRRSTVS